jgi:hypothetical protein
MADSIIDPVVAQSLNTGFADESKAASASRMRRWDQLAADSATMWSVYLTSPTVMTGQGIRMLNGTPTTAPLQAPEPQKAG